MDSITAKTAQMAVNTAATNDPAKKKKVYGMEPLAKKMPKNPSQNTIALKTNIRSLYLKPNTPFFKYSVGIIWFYQQIDGTIATVEFSKSTKDGAERDQDRERCQRVYTLAAESLKANGALFYDRQACLYTLLRLGNEEILMEFKGPAVSSRANFIKATFELKPVGVGFQASSNDVKKIANERPALNDNTILEALNLIMSGPAFEKKNVITLGNCVHYLYDPREVKLEGASYPEYGNHYSAFGASKAVKVMEGTGKDPVVGMVIEQKETLFHPDNVNLFDNMSTRKEFTDTLKPNSPAAKILLPYYKDLEVYLNYGSTDEPMIFKIQSFGPSSNECIFDDHDGKRISVTQHYLSKNRIRLQYPDLLTIVAKGRRGKKVNLPVECLVLCESQKVRTSQMTKVEQAQMIRKTATAPHIRKYNTDKVAKAVGLSENACDVVRVGENVEVKGVQLPYPVITFADKATSALPVTGSKFPTDFKKAGNFYFAKDLKNWEIVFVKGSEEPNLAPQLVREMRNCGMKDVMDPKISYIQNGEDLERTFQAAKQNKRDLLFFCIPSNCEYHALIKAFEQKYDQLTQEIHQKTAKDIGKPQTRQNIVNKINMKLGGLNYHISSPHFPDGNFERILFIGFETSSEGGSGDGPVAIGFSANMQKGGERYSGGYVYAPRSKDTYGSIIAKTLTDIMKTAINADRNKPEEILIYFNGITEGQFGMINEHYLEEIRKGWEGLGSKSAAPKITILAVSKTHNERFYCQDKQTNNLINLPPGTVIDHTITSPVLNQFFLTSAVARQGTVKAPKYTLIYTDYPKQTMERLEGLTNDLCYSHQIVFQPISLPVPLYLAGRCSERGASNLAVMGAVYKNGEVDYEETNRVLGYGGKKLFGTRFNA